MTEESEEDLAEIKMIAELIFDAEQGKFKSMRNRRLELEEKRHCLQQLANEARAGAGDALTDMSVLLTYLDALAVRVSRLREEDETLLAQEHSQKTHLKNALARQLRLEDSENK